MAAVGSRPGTDSSVEQADPLQADDERYEVSSASNKKSQKRSVLGSKRNAALPTPSTSKASLASGTSALAALRAKRLPQGIGAEPIVAPSDLVKAQAPSTTRGKQKGKSALHRTPAQQTAGLEVEQAASAAGAQANQESKLGISRSIAARTPLLKRAMSNISDGTDPLSQDLHTVTRRTAATGDSKVSEVPSRKPPPRNARKDSIYDFGESSKSPEAAARVRGLATSTKTPRRGTRRLAAKQSSKTSGARSLQQSNRGRGSAGRQRVDREHSAAEMNSRRSRMKVESNDNTSKAAGHLTGPTPKGKTRQNDDLPPRTNRQNETVDLSNAVPFVAKVDGRGVSTRAQRDYGEIDDVKVRHRSAINDTGKPVNHERPRKAEQSADGPALQNSKNEPVFLSSREPTSSPTSTAPVEDSLELQQAVERQSANSRQNQARKSTEVPSSPPAPRSSLKVLIPATSKKPTVIAFDKSGPLNQGLVSTKINKQISMQGSRSSIPPQPRFGLSDAPNNARIHSGSKRRSSTSTTGPKVNYLAVAEPRGNVAGDVMQALNSFGRRSSSTNVLHDDVLEHEPTTSNQAGHRPTDIQQAYDDDGFIPIDYIDVITAAADREPAETIVRANASSKRTDSRIAMPPPPQSESLGALRKKDGLSSTTTGAVSKSQQTEVSQRTITATKRRPDPDPSQEPAPKRKRTSTGTQKPNTAGAGSSDHLERQYDPRIRQTRSIIAERTKGAQTTQRRSTHNSQKVDIQGSPVPAGMVVDAASTVLDTYSQQAGISSDGVILTEHESSSSVSFQTVETQKLAQDFVPPSHQPTVLSSNKKSKPAAPEHISRALEKFVEVDTREPAVIDSVQAPANDPFTSSDEQRKIPRKGSTSLELWERLKGKIREETINEIRHHPATPQIPKEVLDFVRQQPRHDQSLQQKPNANQHIISLDEQSAKAAHDLRRQLQEEDPDKTLVEEEPVYNTKKRKRELSISTVSSGSSASATNSQEPILDIAAWRTALQPHQMNVFDGLVMVSHKLVRHLVDCETAAKDLVDDYRRKGEMVVEQMERSHAAKYQKCMDKLKLRKRQLRSEYKSCNKLLRESVAEVQTRRRERKEMLAGREDVVERLEEIVEAYC